MTSATCPWTRANRRVARTRAVGLVDHPRGEVGHRQVDARRHGDAGIGPHPARAAAHLEHRRPRGQSELRRHPREPPGARPSRSGRAGRPGGPGGTGRRTAPCAGTPDHPRRTSIGPRRRTVAAASASMAARPGPGRMVTVDPVAPTAARSPHAHADHDRTTPRRGHRRARDHRDRQGLRPLRRRLRRRRRAAGRRRRRPHARRRRRAARVRRPLRRRRHPPGPPARPDRPRHPQPDLPGRLDGQRPGAAGRAGHRRRAGHDRRVRARRRPAEAGGQVGRCLPPGGRQRGHGLLRPRHGRRAAQPQQRLRARRPAPHEPVRHDQRAARGDRRRPARSGRPRTRWPGSGTRSRWPTTRPRGGSPGRCTSSTAAWCPTAASPWSSRRTTGPATWPSRRSTCGDGPRRTPATAWSGARSGVSSAGRRSPARRRWRWPASRPPTSTCARSTTATRTRR